jgi:hypothetical protein
MEACCGAHFLGAALAFWLQLVGVRDLRSVIVDNAWNRDRQESEVSGERQSGSGKAG